MAYSGELLTVSPKRGCIYEDAALLSHNFHIALSGSRYLKPPALPKVPDLHVELINSIKPAIIWKKFGNKSGDMDNNENKN